MLIYIKITKHLSRKYRHEMQNRPLGDQAIPLPLGPTVVQLRSLPKLTRLLWLAIKQKGGERCFESTKTYIAYYS